MSMPIEREKELYSQIEALRSEIERLHAYLRSCRIMLRDGGSREETINEIGRALGVKTKATRLEDVL